MANKVSLSTIQAQIDDLQTQIDQIEGGSEVSANIDMKNLYKVINSIAPTNPADLATKSYVDTQIDNVETGTISLLFNQPNYSIFGSTNLSPDFPTKYLGTQGFLTNANIDDSANIAGSKIADSSITNAKLTTVDGSRLVNLSVTNEKISSMASTKITGTIEPTQISPGTANQILSTNGSLVPTWIAQPSTLPTSTAQGQILTSDVSLNPQWSTTIPQSSVTNLATDLSTLQNYFLSSRLKLANLTKGGNNTILSQDSTANDPAYRQIDSTYITSLDQSKINQNNNNQNMKYCDSTNFPNITTFINGLATGSFAQVYPANLSGTGYGITTNDTWTAINCDVIGVPYKSRISYSVAVGQTSQTLNIGLLSGSPLAPRTIYGQYYLSLNFNPTCNINVFLNACFENCQFNQPMNLILADTTTPSNTFCMFINCTFNQAITFTSIPSTATVYFFDCNFTAKNFVITSNLGRVVIANCTGLNNLNYNPVTSKIFLAGTNGDYLGQSQINVSSKAFYDSALNTKYLYTTSDISSTAGILGTQLSANANLALTQINKTGATTGQVISYNGTNIVWGNQVPNLLPLNNSWTGTNTYTNQVDIFSTFNVSPNASPTINMNSTDLFHLWYTNTNTIDMNLLVDGFSFTVNNKFLNFLTDGLYVNLDLPSDAYSATGFQVLNAATRADSRVITRVPTSILPNIPGLIQIGTGGNRTTADSDTVFVGGALAGQGNGKSKVFIGWSDDVTAATPKVTNKSIQIGDSSTDGIIFTKNDGITLFQDYRISFTGAGCAVLNSVTASVYQPSSVDFKTNLRNKSQEYIWNSATAVKNYYQKIIDLPIYTYTYKKPDGSAEPELIQGICFEDLYDTFSHCTTYVPEIGQNKPDISYFDGSENNKKRMVRKGALVEYLVLCLQEQDKFIIQPMKQQINTLQTRYDNLVNALKASQILPSNF